MNEAETRRVLIDPQLEESGWESTEGAKILREYQITQGKLQSGGRGKALAADYILMYKNQKLAVIEAKSDEKEVGEGVAQAKDYADKLGVETTFSANGREIYQICMTTGQEKLVNAFPTPEALWQKTFPIKNVWQELFNTISFEPAGHISKLYYYQEIAINRTMAAIANHRTRMLLTLATGTGKTLIASQIAWKLFQARWNLKLDGVRRPRILFLADRNILANQAFNGFRVFHDNELVRIDPNEIKKTGYVPRNGSVFFTIFQTFMSGKDEFYFREYENDFFDLIIIDECHRGGSRNESKWRGILEYFSPAVQLGLTATPKREENADTYQYFGEPLYVYSLNQGIEDGFLTPFRVKRINTTIDNYVYDADDDILEGEVREGQVFVERDFNKIIEIKARENYRVQTFLNDMNLNEKTLVFCASQAHAALVRDLINQNKKSVDPKYCVRVTANDDDLGEQYLQEFQDNENLIPTILTTSRKLSTGVDARNVRNIVLMRPINSMIEFKQIIGRGTRLFDDKFYFTIYDFVGAYQHFLDRAWDGEPVEEIVASVRSQNRNDEQSEATDVGSIDMLESHRRRVTKIKLQDGKERAIQHTTSTLFWGKDKRAMTADEFLTMLYGTLPEFFKDENELRQIWSNPQTRKTFLEKLDESGCGYEEFKQLQKLIQAENSDLYDVLEYVAYAVTPSSRLFRVDNAKSNIFSNLNHQEKEFIQFVLDKYIETGVEELDQDKLPDLLKLKYHTISDAEVELGDLQCIRHTFANFQKYLYQTYITRQY